MKAIWALALGIGCSVAVVNAQAQAVANPQAVGNAAAGRAKAAVCAGCHGPDGNSMVPQFPKLAGQSARYIVHQLQDFKSGKRVNATMQPFAQKLSAQDMEDVAAYFNSQKLKPGNTTADKKTLALGQRLYRGGDAKTEVPACMSCHGPAGRGIPPHFPQVASQWAPYTEAQLTAFRDHQRTNDAGIMQTIAGRLNEAQIKAIAQYMSGLY